MSLFNKKKNQFTDDQSLMEELEFMEIDEDKGKEQEKSEIEMLEIDEEDNHIKIEEMNETKKNEDVLDIEKVDELAEEDVKEKTTGWKRFINKRNGIIAGATAVALVCTVVIVIACTKKKSVVVATEEPEQTTQQTTQEVSTEQKKEPLLQMKLEAIADETSITAKVLAEDGTAISGQEFVVNVLEGSVEDNKDAVAYIKSEKDKVNQEKVDATKTTEAVETTGTTDADSKETSEVPEKLAGAAEYKDDDMDGSIYIGDLSTGTYTVAVRAKEGYDVPDAVETSIVKYEVIENILEEVVQQDEETRKEDPSQDREPSSGSGTTNVGATTPSGNKTTITVTYPKVDANNNSSAEYCRYVYTATEETTLSDVQVEEYEKAEDVSIQQSSGAVTLVSGYIEEMGTATGENGTVTVIKKLIVEKNASVSENKTNNLGTPSGTEGTTAGTEGTTGATESTTQATTAAPKQYVIYNLSPVMETKEVEVFDGWVTDGGLEYYYSSGNKYTGWHLIDGLNYYFNSDGVLSSEIVIDVSQFNGWIDWNAVKASGVDRALIRVGYRGWGSGKLVYDDSFYENISGARAAGIEVGAYVVTQAVNTSEAVAEASFIIEACSGYGASLPLAIDVEAAGGAGGTGRGDLISVETRTAVINAFASTVANAGYTPMVYASKSWLEGMINASAINSNCQVWVAQYKNDLDETEYQGRYNMWQFRSDGAVSGIGGSVDVSAWIR